MEVDISGPSCGSQWGFNEIQFQVCGDCGYPEHHEDDDIFDEDDDWDFDCQMQHDGYCGAAGSEFCEFECSNRYFSGCPESVFEKENRWSKDINQLPLI